MSSMAKKCLITAGPTREFFDPVRYISNPSSGKMGYAIARAAVAAGWEVTLISGPVSLPVPAGVKFFRITSGEELLEKTQEQFVVNDLLIMTAAVCDMRPKVFNKQKQKKDALSMTLEMEPVPDILRSLIELKTAGQTVVGFAAETNDVIQHAKEKLERKKLDWIVANQVGGEATAFESDCNAVTLLGRNDECYKIGPDHKEVIAKELVSILQNLMN